MPTQQESELSYVKSLADPYAKYSGFANQPLALSGFSPEVISALQANDKGGKNIIIGGQLVERDPNFSFTPTTPISSSTAVRDTVTNLGNGLTTLSNNIPNIYDPSNLEKSRAEAGVLFNDRRAELTRRRDAEVARIQNEFADTERATGVAQENETGSTTSNLLRIGGSLGGSASEQGALLKLEKAHRDEMASLVAKRQNAIAIAQNAFNDKDFELAQAQFNAVRDIDKDIYGRQKDFLSYTLDLRTADREDQRLNMDKQKNQKDFLNFAIDNGVTSKFFELAGQTYFRDPETNQMEPVTDKNRALELGIKPDMSNVQVIKPSKNYPAGMVGEYLFYADQQQAQGQPVLDFNSYQNLDANRKERIARAGSSTTIINDATKEYELKVKQAGAKIRELAQAGYSWGQSADYMQSNGIDPADVDDALHRAYNTSAQYDSWKNDEALRKQGLKP